MAGQASEKKLLEHIRRIARVKGRDLIVGIGDDCAALRQPAGRELLLSSDLLIEGVHFRLDWTTPFWLGYKALAVNVSDIAAMGGRPTAYLVSLGLPRQLSNPRFVASLYRGMEVAAKEHRVVLAGGDLSGSPCGVVISIAIAGQVQPGEKILRSGAQPGDQIFIAGWLGLSAIGFELLRSGYRLSRAFRVRVEDGPSGKSPFTPAQWRQRCMMAHLAPRPPLRLAMELGSRKLIHAMMDISDGLSIDLRRLCDASRVGAVVLEAELPSCPRQMIHPQLQGRCVLHGGEDYALLFTVPPPALGRLRSIVKKYPDLPITRIGEITSGSRIFLQRTASRVVLQPRGFDHFSGNKHPHPLSS